MGLYQRPHYSDPHPLLLPIVAPQVLRSHHRETGLPPAALLLLLAVEVIIAETQTHVRAANLQTGWLSARLVRGYVRQLIAKGLLQRQKIGRRGRVLQLTSAGHSLILTLRRELRTSARQLLPEGFRPRWPRRA